MQEGSLKVGPWGSTGGAHPFEFKPRGRITKINIRTGGRGGCIDSISFEYYDPSSRQVYCSPKYGGAGGHLSESMYLEKGEEIVEMSGTVGCYDGWKVITSLCFKTNKRSCEFGSVCGEKFTLPLKTKTGRFAGFHGRYGAYIDSIGAILEVK
ncbi:hypothetical protein OSB04_021514 [Centaurea solstitialis]|uniref:Jacalin-type lectin domain-containing protein n=1 Tax=Centaurea solstitialis TaxID=347529 RepID=A0AA38T7Q6_9ASTR|nr:hypothetical protein OSB04_021514 [Centaurea solstitialis]